MTIVSRRKFVVSTTAAVLSGALRRAARAAGGAEAPPDPGVKRILVMFKTHFDAGYTDTQANVVRAFFDRHFPAAIRTAEEMRRSGEDRFTWTTGSWLLYEYLDQARGEALKRIERAVGERDLAWHALPFTWQSEMLDRSLLAGAVGISKELDRRFGRRTTGSKLSDVAGHTRAIVPPLAEQGVTFLHIGPNGHDALADLPAIFNWRDPSGASLVVMYSGGYGGRGRIPGSDLVVDINVHSENADPMTPEEVRGYYADLRRRYPNASVRASDLSEIADAIQPYKGNLAVVTQEMGDTWIYGVASDPTKVRCYLEVCRLRRRWIAEGKFQVGDSTDVALLRRLVMAPEHCWGISTKDYLDTDHYRPRDLERMIDTAGYARVRFSWEEKRRNLFDGLARLPETLQGEAAGRLAALAPVEPSTLSLTRHPGDEMVATPHYELALDSRTGALRLLRQTGSEWGWAWPDRPLALFSYQTLSAADYRRFMSTYLRHGSDWWTEYDFGKPNLGTFRPESRTWLPSVRETWLSQEEAGTRIIARLEIEDPESASGGDVAWPRFIYLEYFLPRGEAVVEIKLSWFEKPANRIPEAMYLSFHPPAGRPELWMEKSGEWISPLDVVPGGGHGQHAVTRLRLDDVLNHSMMIETIDAPLLVLGEKSPLNFSRDLPDLNQGFHFCLYNNAWGTNYPQWFGEDASFRFRVRLSS